MIRTVGLMLALCATLGMQPSAEPEPDPRRTALNITRTLILTFNTRLQI